MIMRCGIACIEVLNCDRLSLCVCLFVCVYMCVWEGEERKCIDN